ncbi:MAG: leucine-rich repeat domain-containing protein [Candidatus Cyclobacteriaceae bacterium M3_2C_046]
MTFLSDLQVLWLKGNQLEGTIPAGIDNLSNLQVLWLSHNQFSGSLSV